MSSRKMEDYMETHSHRISDSLFLVHQKLNEKAPAEPVEIPVNHIAVIDCSGSMYYDLPKIREQLKKRIPKLLSESDTLSVIWFSGRGQYGTLLEAEPVSTLADLQDINRAIDRWLKPVGLTGFKEPLQETKELIERVGKKNSNPFALFFMSDGCDNLWDRREILKAAEETASGLSSATFVEYGYYADRPLLTKMAEKSGGSLIFAQDFDNYSPLFESAVLKKVSGAPRVEIAVDGDCIGGFAFSMVNGEIYSYEVNGGKAQVPEDLHEIWYLSPSEVGTTMRYLQDLTKVSADTGKTNQETDAAYAAISLFSLRAQPKVVYPLLKATGDVHFIEEFGGCFGKQKYTEFMESAKSAAFGKGRFQDGWDPDSVPRDDAFTVLEFLNILSSDEENRVLLDHEAFDYNRTSRARVDVSHQPSQEELDRGKELAKKLATADPKEMEELQKEIASLNLKTQEQLKFVEDDAPNGYGVNNLVFNEERPNVSIQIKKTGHVDLSSRITDDIKKAGVPANFQSYIFRNYTIIRDGIINVQVLPVSLSNNSLRQLLEAESTKRLKEGVIVKSGDCHLVHLDRLPVVNRDMVKSASAKELFEKVWELTKLRASQKVYNSIKKEEFPTVSRGFKEVYGEEAASWLQEQGITDYRGYSPPKTKQAEASDFYYAKLLKVSIKGFSSIPSLNDCRKRIASGKLTPPAALMVPAIEEVDEFLKSEVYKKASNQKSLFETWLVDRFKDTQKQVRSLIFDTSQIRFSIIVGQTWFDEFSSIEEDSMDIKIDGRELKCKVEMKEKEIHI